MAGVLMAAALALATAAPPQTQAAQGRLQGAWTADGGAVFRGVPFAAPPVAALRWRPPQPPASWAGVRSAAAPAPSCPQTDYGAWNARDAARGREDCLYLDVSTPRLDPKARAPVMVWIHGGGNRGGSMGDTVLSPLARRGVVLVAIQYRLAALGFMAHPALSAEQGGASGGYGLMDQQAALRWVRANIARFGGDPDNVTVFGESAGAQDAALLMVEPGARGLFAKVIAESGSVSFGVPARDLPTAEAIGVQLAQRAGAPAQASAAVLRALPVDRLLAAPETASFASVADPSFVWLQDTIDGRVLREDPEATLRAGRQARVPLLIGTNARELALYGGLDAALTRIFGPRAAEARRAYGVAGGRGPAPDPRLGSAADRVATDATFRCPALRAAEAQAAVGAPAYLYLFDHTPRDGGAVSHASELPFVFDGLPIGSGGPTMQDDWIAFARTGDPNGAGRPAWPKVRSVAPSWMAFRDEGAHAAPAAPLPPCRLLPKL